MLAKPESALLLVGHGSMTNPDSSVPTYAHLQEIRRRRCFAEAVACFWKEEPGMRQVYHMLDCEEIYVVPNFISEGYFTRKVIPRELELEGPVTRRGRQVIKYCQPVGSHPGMTDVLLHRARTVAPDVTESSSSLLIAGHGTDLNDQSARAVKRQVEKIRARTDYAAVLSCYMEEEPHVSSWAELTDSPNVIVVPMFISDGLHSYQDIPVMLGIEPEPPAAASRQKVFRRNPYRLRGRQLYYAGAIGTEPLMADVILDQVEAFDREHPTDPTAGVSRETR